ncbi:thiamine-phosphate kinase [Pseudactinotalea sp. HY158]|nr:thiamine-phosphate kinase [Pseudactinotalea sp. HY158]
MPVNVSEVDEGELLGRIFPRLPTGASTLLGPGDDAAIVAAPDGRVVVSTDVLVAGRHFRLDWSTGADVGYRAASQNLADIAAMGARPTAIVVGLVLPAATPVAWVEDLADGLALACSPLGVGVVGGDLVGGRELVVSVTVHGDCRGRAPVTRAGARPGHVIGLCGTLGRSAAGWAALERFGPDAGRDPALVGHGVFRRPVPPLPAGVRAAEAGASAMMDVSDGLLKDGARLALASGVTLALDSAALAADLADLAPAGALLGVDPWTWLLGGGEDHALLAVFPDAGRAEVAGFRVVGAVVEAREDGPVLLDGHAPGRRRLRTGWDHFRA